MESLFNLTEEQKERIRRNRANALELRRNNQTGKSETKKRGRQKDQDDGDNNLKRRQATIDENHNHTHSADSSSSANGNLSSKATHPQEMKAPIDEDDLELEDFEISASPWVTKREAQKMYCLPEGTLAVCEIAAEKDNPHGRGFAKMKLYSRSEIRRRARERHGGLDGLVKERRKREEARFEKDLRKTKNVFQTEN